MRFLLSQQLAESLARSSTPVYTVHRTLRYTAHPAPVRPAPLARNQPSLLGTALRLALGPPSPPLVRPSVRNPHRGFRWQPFAATVSLTEAKVRKKTRCRAHGQVDEISVEARSHSGGSGKANLGFGQAACRTPSCFKGRRPVHVGTSLARDHAFLPHSKRPARLRGRLTAELRAGRAGAPLRVWVPGNSRNPRELEYHPDGANLHRSSPPGCGNAPVQPIQRWLCRIRGSCERRLPTSGYSDGLRAGQ